MSLNVYSQVEIKQLNKRFSWIKAPSRLVKARLTKPIDGLSICAIEVIAPKTSFNFVTRRAVPYEECMSIVLEARKILKINKFVEVIGTSPSKDLEISNMYVSFWDLIRGDSGTGCNSYFGNNCDEKSSLYDELGDWKNKAIDPKIYP